MVDRHFLFYLPVNVCVFVFSPAWLLTWCCYLSHWIFNWTTAAYRSPPTSILYIYTCTVRESVEKIGWQLIWPTFQFSKLNAYFLCHFGAFCLSLSPTRYTCRNLPYLPTLFTLFVYIECVFWHLYVKPTKIYHFSFVFSQSVSILVHIFLFFSWALFGLHDVFCDTGTWPALHWQQSKNVCNIRPRR